MSCVACKHGMENTASLCLSPHGCRARRGLWQKCSHSVACAPSPPRRHLWQHVTSSLKEGNIDAATEHKHCLEERQRAEERQRVALATPWKPKYFAKEVLPLSGFKDPIACFCIHRGGCYSKEICGVYHGLVLLYTTDSFKFYFCQSLALKRAAMDFSMSLL